MFDVNWNDWKEMFDFLEQLEVEVRKVDSGEFLGKIEEAKSYFEMSSPTEFLGETYLTLKSIRSSSLFLSRNIRDEMDKRMKKIKDAFHKSGMDID